ncbi:hypothetical protein FGIG_07018, partial [Fasciola gigantica]
SLSEWNGQTHSKSCEEYTSALLSGNLTTSSARGKYQEKPNRRAIVVKNTVAHLPIRTLNIELVPKDLPAAAQLTDLALRVCPTGVGNTQACTFMWSLGGGQRVCMSFSELFWTVYDKRSCWFGAKASWTNSVSMRIAPKSSVNLFGPGEEQRLLQLVWIVFSEVSL